MYHIYAIERGRIPRNEYQGQRPRLAVGTGLPQPGRIIRLEGGKNMINQTHDKLLKVLRMPCVPIESSAGGVWKADVLLEAARDGILPESCVAEVLHNNLQLLISAYVPRHARKGL